MRIPVVALILACFCTPARAQGPRIEVFGGYSYLNIDPGTNLVSRQSANGWEASVSGDVHRWFGLEASVAGYYKTIPLGTGLPDVKVHDYSYAAGPRLNYRPFFVHALVGGDHLTGSLSGASSSQDSFAAAFGGGVVWPIARRWAVRASGDYVLTRHNLIATNSITQNNFRASVGIVYIFGGRGERAPRAEVPATPMCAGSSEITVMGIVGCSSSNGFKVTSVRPDSSAASAGIVVGDMIIEIDGRQVHTSQEIEAAIAANTFGVVKVGYMIQGKWLTERQAKIR